MKIIKQNFAILFLLFICMLAISNEVHASENSSKTVTSYEMLLEEIDNATEATTIVLARNITVDNTIKITDNKNIIIKASEKDNISITSNHKENIFFIGNGSELTLENIQLVVHSANRAIYNEGTLTLRGSEEVDYRDYFKNDAGGSYVQEPDSHESFSNLDIASFVISWSGFALAFLTIAAGALSFMGLKEIKDLQKVRNEVKGLQKKYNAEVNKIKNFEEKSKKQLEILEKRFEDEAQSLLYATYYYSMGTDAYRRTKYREAIEHLKRSINFFPKNTDAICLIGRAYAFTGDRNTSYEYYQQALKIDTNCAAAFRGLSAWYRYEQPILALEYAKKAVENKPQDFEILNYYAQLLRDNNKLSESMDIYLKSYSIKRHPDTCFFLSILYLADDSYGRARTFIQEAIEGYNNEEEFGITKPVWRELAVWVQILAENSANTEFDQALHQLDNVKAKIDSDKTRQVVVGHIKFALNSIQQTKEYINLSIQKVS